MRRVRRLAVLALALFLAQLLGILGFIALYDPPEVLPPDATIVALGAGQRPDGAAGPASRLRTEAAVALYRSGIGTRIVLTGGQLYGETRSIGAAMADIALSAGLPADAVIVEPRALSTLQNALFTADLLGPAADGPIILVTQRFHLPRAWLSFRWAGMHDLTLYPADTVRQHWQTAGLREVLNESVKTPLNAIRALGASALTLAGLPEDRYIRLLD